MKDVTDLNEYASREAERVYNVAWAQTGYKGGILHLAEQLQRDDVIESGAAAVMEIPMTVALCPKSVVRTVVGAMLAKIAEGGEGS